VDELGGTAVAVVADAADDAESKRMVDEAAAGLGGLDGLVLNLGVARVGGLDTTADDWDLVMAVNLRSHFLAARHALPLMEEGGSIVLISSIAATVPLPGMPAYTASKAALSGLVLSLAGEGARRGVRANVVAPGLIDTPLGRLSAQANPERSKARIPLRRDGTAWDVANAVVFLLSDEAAYVTAQELQVDGGLGRLRV
jgi:NAD(P)-dependent dehydrogenase (short-subunit alcohol dehydrogenase family)